MFYQLSKDDRVIALSEDWDQVAQTHSSPGALAAKVKGHSLWSFVQGHETRSYLNALFFTCRRTLLPVHVTYRCDGPDETRSFRMEITSLGEGALNVSHSAIPKLTQVLHSVVVLDDMRPSCQCSQCLSVLISGQWVDQIYILRDADFPVTYVICPNCRSMALGRIEELHEVIQLYRR